nr:MAG TPA: hypothetical protein [Bacteriophage sp.]
MENSKCLFRYFFLIYIILRPLIYQFLVHMNIIKLDRRILNV